MGKRISVSAVLAMVCSALMWTSCVQTSSVLMVGVPHVQRGSEAGRWDATPTAVTALIEKVAQRQDIIRAYWFIYPHGDKAGYRVLIQANSRCWIELWSSGEVIRSLVEGRAFVNGAHGTRLLRLGDARSDLQVEAFIPDSSSQTQVAYFRVREHGLPGQWGTLSVVNLIK